MIKPTVGRVVWYRPNETDAITLGVGLGRQPLAAHVAYVHSDTMVNLMVIDPNGYPRSRTSVRLMQEGLPALAGESFCEWMPYQVGQAKKHEGDKIVSSLP